ncbi:UNVERIFIED_ORG: hypothetical protein M2328_006772 [Rhodococcus erythropolis]
MLSKFVLRSLASAWLGTFHFHFSNSVTPVRRHGMRLGAPLQSTPPERVMVVESGNPVTYD